MSRLLSFMAVIFFFFLVGFGGVFLTTSALCGEERLQCIIGDSFGYPFSYIDSNSDCGYPGLAFSCSKVESRPVINISGNHYYILDIEERRQSVRIVGVDVDEKDCPRPIHNFTLPTTPPFLSPYSDKNAKIIYFYNCSSGYPKDVEQGLPCLDTYFNNITTPGLRSFAFSSSRYGYSADYRFNWFTRNCQENVVVPVQYVSSSSDLKRSLKLGFNLDWLTPEKCKDCEESGGQCWFNQSCSCPQHGTDQTKLFDKVCPPIQNISQQQQGPTSVSHPPPPNLLANTSQSGLTTIPHQTAARYTKQKIIILGVCSGVGGLLLVTLFNCRRKLFLLYASTVSHWNSKIKSPENMEAFLESCGCPGLQRFRYSQVKKMTNTFKEKLGQGGFGSVFKGKLFDGRLVAIKVLDESKGNGEDFINEVATIGWTNHVNVVRLLGFCCNGNKRALVYEFMPNGSLEKFIYNRENTSITNPPLGWEKLYQIALGIAKGLEYLHCGCNSRILHFDIKPHNILLGQDFCPKISDFGLAKLCQTRESIVSMHVARGTIGYIAPEVYCRNFGGVSNKSDVYSYGMMIFEMIGGRKNIDATVENISEIYFPQWIYNHLKRENGVVDAKEIYTEKTTKRMIIVALWCIQTHPFDRPSISKVVEMLEGNVDELQMPSNPFQCSPSRSSS